MTTPTDSRASTKQAAQYLQQFYAAERDKQERPAAVPPRRSLSPVLALILIPLSLGLTAWNVRGASQTGPAFTAAQSEDATRFAMYVVIRQVEHFRRVNGRLPASLEMIDPGEDQVRYQSNFHGFVVTAETASGVLVYRDGDDISPFAAAAAGRLGGLDQ